MNKHVINIYLLLSFATYTGYTIVWSGIQYTSVHHDRLWYYMLIS